MSITYRTLAQHNLTAFSLSGLVSLETMKVMLGELKTDPDFVWTHDRILFLHSDTDLSELRMEDFLDVKQAMINAFIDEEELRTMARPAYRVAVVCDKPLKAVAMKLFDALWKIDNPPLVEAGHFPKAPEALNWLRGETLPLSEFDEELRGLET